MELNLENEQDAAVAILFSCVMYKHKNLSQSTIEQLSRILVLCSRFKGNSLNDLTIKALSLQAQYDSQTVIEQASPLITEEFRETLFAMICEVMTGDGVIDESKSEVLGMAALYLQIPVERMKMMLTTYLIRNKWNVQIIDQLHG
jgi:uncharacterized tellurite resistance protein B-like protein